MRKMIEITMRKGFLILAASLLLVTSCKQKVQVVEKIQVVDSEGKPVDVASATEINNTFVDIALPGPQGQTVRVRDYVGQNKLVLIDFWASWCGPCRMIAPNVEAVGKEMSGKLTVVKFNLEQSGADPIVRRYKIEAIPCLILFDKGKEAGRNVGYMTKEELRTWLKKYIK